MIQKGIGVFTALTLLSVGAHAGSAPKEFYGKSITVQWSESVTGRQGGDQTAQSWLGVHLLSIYISSTGRPFVRRTGSSVGGASRYGGGAGTPTFITAPGQSSGDHVDFQGRSIFVTRENVSGARRIAIDFDDTGCKATVIYGRLGGKNIELQHQGRGQVEISSIQVGTVSCSIRDGNVFAQ